MRTINLDIMVNYRATHGDNGTCYDQTVKIEKEYQDEINMYIKANIDLIKRNYDDSGSISGIDLHVLTYLSLADMDVNYTNLTTSRYVRQWLEINGVNVDRYLLRNTIIQFI